MVAGLCIALCCLGTQEAQAQTPRSAKALGMGGSYTAVARGHEALLYNPANLGLSDSPSWSFALAGVAVGGTSGGPAFRDYADFALGNGNGEALLSSVPEGGASLDLDAHASALTFQRGGFAFGASYHAVAHQEAPRDMFELYLNGPEAGRFDYQTAGTTTSEADYIDVAAGYGFNMGEAGGGELSVGAAVHYLHGRQLASRSVVSDPRVGADEVEMDYRELRADGGNGFALDVGAAWKPTPKWTISGSVTNLVSTMSWSNLREYTRTGSANELLDFSLFNGSSSTSGEGTSVEAGDPDAEALRTMGRLPRTVRLGGAYQPFRRTQLAAAYQRQVTDGGLAGGWEDAMSVGLEQNVPILPLTVRGGYVAAFDEGSMFTLGATALGFVHAGLARMSYENADAVAQDHWTVSLGISFSGRRPWLGGK